MDYAKYLRHIHPFFLPRRMLVAFLMVAVVPSTTLAQQGSSSDEFSNTASIDGQSSSSSGGRTKPSSQMDRFRNDLVSKLRNIDFATLLTPSVIEVDDKPVLKKEAEMAFQAGNQSLAMDLMFGYMVAEYEKANDDLQAVKYSPLLRRPVWQTRWGVSWAIRGADEVGDPQPIRDGKTPGGRSVAGGAGGFQGSNPTNSSDPMPSPISANQVFANPTTNRISNMPMTSMLNDEAERELDNALGLVAEMVGEEFETRYQRGDFGPALVGITPPDPPAAPARGGFGTPPPVTAPIPGFTQEVADALEQSGDPLPMWRPGIVYLGEGDSSDTLKKAQTENIDFLLHFDVFVKQTGRTDAIQIQNVSRCRLLQVANGKALGVTKAMDSSETARLTQSGRGDVRSYVREQLETFFGIVDRQVKTIDLPKLSPEVAKKRVAALIATFGGQTTLRTLAEIRLYQAQGLLDEPTVDTVFNILGGEEALTMVHGVPQDRLTTARQWAVKLQNLKDDKSSF